MSVTLRVKTSWQFSEGPYSSEPVTAGVASHSPDFDGTKLDEHTQLVTVLTTHGPEWPSTSDDSLRPRRAASVSSGSVERP